MGSTLIFCGLELILLPLISPPIVRGTLDLSFEVHRRVARRVNEAAGPEARGEQGRDVAVGHEQPVPDDEPRTAVGDLHGVRQVDPTDRREEGLKPCFERTGVKTRAIRVIRVLSGGDSGWRGFR